MHKQPRPLLKPFMLCSRDTILSSVSAALLKWSTGNWCFLRGKQMLLAIIGHTGIAGENLITLDREGESYLQYLLSIALF